MQARHPLQEHSWSHQILNFKKGLLHDMSPPAVQDEIIKTVTGDRRIPPHHVEAMTASEAYRQA